MGRILKNSKANPSKNDGERETGNAVERARLKGIALEGASGGKTLAEREAAKRALKG